MCCSCKSFLSPKPCWTFQSQPPAAAKRKEVGCLCEWPMSDKVAVTTRDVCCHALVFIVLSYTDNPLSRRCPPTSHFLTLGSHFNERYLLVVWWNVWNEPQPISPDSPDWILAATFVLHLQTGWAC